MSSLQIFYFHDDNTAGHTDLNSTTLRVIPGRLAVLDHDILSIHLSEVGEPSQKNLVPGCGIGGSER